MQINADISTRLSICYCQTIGFIPYLAQDFRNQEKVEDKKKNLQPARLQIPLHSENGAPGGIRTHDPLLRRQLLYPLSYQGTYFELKIS